MMSGEHTSKVFDQELEAMRSSVLQMGGIVESQVRTAFDALDRGDLRLADQVIDADRRVNRLELELDRSVNNVIARRQPTAGDLRMIMGVAKTITELERVGDEATKIARVAKWLHEKELAVRIPRVADVMISGEAARSMLQRALNAFARLDVAEAAEIIRDDQGLDERFKGSLRQLITYMMEDPRTISAAIDLIWVAKAVERIGDHAKNVAEHVIFIARGTDVRHATPDEVARSISEG